VKYSQYLPGSKQPELPPSLASGLARDGQNEKKGSDCMVCCMIVFRQEGNPDCDRKSIRVPVGIAGAIQMKSQEVDRGHNEY
jgi:hypothetical protein